MNTIASFIQRSRRLATTSLVTAFSFFGLLSGSMAQQAKTHPNSTPTPPSKATSKAPATLTPTTNATPHAKEEPQGDIIIIEEIETESQDKIFPNINNLEDDAKTETEEISIKNITRNPENLFHFLNDHSDKSKYSRYIINGQWRPLNKELLLKLPKKKAQDIFNQILDQLAYSTQETKAPERLITFNDVIGLASISPLPLNEQSLQQLGIVVRSIVESGTPADQLFELLKKNPAPFGTATYQNKKNTSILLASGGLIQDVPRYLPPLKEAKNKQDYFIVTLHLTTSITNAKTPTDTRNAWRLNEWLLSQNDIPNNIQPVLTDSIIALLPLIHADVRKSWLESIPTTDPELFGEILKKLYNNSNTRSSSTHYTPLNAWKSLLETSFLIPGFSKIIYRPWEDVVNAFSLTWIKEVNHTFTRKQENRQLSRGQRSKKDFLSIAQLFELNPDSPELNAIVQKDVAFKLRESRAKLYISLGEIDAALSEFSGISQYSKSKALDLSEQLLLTWAYQANPNRIATSQKTNRSKDAVIPLTGIRQARNIEKLTKLYKSIHKLQIGEVSDQVLVTAFALCHSKVETYQKKDIISVFGPIAKIKSSRIQLLAQQMIKNLQGAWSMEKSQKEFDTGRTPQELKKSLDSGYALLIQMLSESLKYNPNYKLQTLVGDTYRLKSNFIMDQQGLNNSLYQNENPIQCIQLALKNYEKSVLLYQQDVPSLAPSQYDISPFTHWFNTLIASYSSGFKVDPKNLESWGFAKIRKFILSTPDPNPHMELFGKSMQQTLKRQSPEDKKARVYGALIVLQNHPSANIIKEHQKYYQELVKEIKLHTSLLPALTDQPLDSLDGNLGLFISLHHTDKISRECHGFSQFVAPAGSKKKEDHRALFTQMITETLSKQFEIKSITYAPAGTRARPLISHGKSIQGWSETPLAFVQLFKTSPETDKIPALHIDLPFRDFTGNASILFYSNVIPLPQDSPSKKTHTPKNLQIFQTLNENTRDPNSVVLEIRATSDGMIPALEKILNLSFKDFKILSQTDEGLQIQELVLRDSQNLSDHPSSERSWTITLSLPEFSPNKPTQFHFPTPKDASVPVEYHRYVDADLAKVGPVIDFDAKEMESPYAWVWWLILIPVIGFALWYFFYQQTHSHQDAEEIIRYSIPESLNAFTCAALLMTIRKDGVIKDPKKQKELDTDIQKVEAAGFAPKDTSKIDLKKISKKWIQNAN